MYTYYPYREFYLPTRIVMGRGSVRNVGKEFLKFGAKKIMIVTDPGVEKAGITKPVKEALEADGIAYALYAEVEANPTTVGCAKASEVYSKEKCEAVLGVGGGSSIDTAKAVSVVATNGGKIEDYAGRDLYKNPPAPLFIIPTTVGTGSEVTSGLVVTNVKTHKKMVPVGRTMYPLVAVLDPEVVQNLPPRITAGTGIDALTHAIEGYVSVYWNPVSDALHRYAILLVGQNLREAVANSANLDAMGNMLIASTLAGMAFTNTGLGLVHAMSHPVGGHFNTPHGETNAILLPHVMRFNWIADVERFSEIALLLGAKSDLSRVELAKISGDIVSELNRDVGIPRGLADLGVDKGACEMLAKEVLTETFLPFNPRKATIEDYAEIYRKAM